MQFFMEEAGQNARGDLIALLEQKGVRISFVTSGVFPRLKSAPMPTIVAVGEMGRTGRAPGLVRRVPATDIEKLGGKIPPWTVGPVIAIAPFDFASLEGPLKRHVRNSALRQIDTALMAIGRDIATGK